jgi:toxin ParE1/3/4
MRIVFTDLADDDLIDIWVHIAPDNEPAADRLIDDVHSLTQKLAQFPLLGRAADHLHPGARSFALHDYLIVYRPMDYGVAILRVVHGSRALNLLDYPDPPPQ